MTNRPCDYCGGPGGQLVEDDYACDGCNAAMIALALIASIAGLGIIAFAMLSARMA